MSKDYKIFDELLSAKSYTLDRVNTDINYYRESISEKIHSDEIEKIRKAKLETGILENLLIHREEMLTSDYNTYEKSGKVITYSEYIRSIK